MAGAIAKIPHETKQRRFRIHWIATPDRGIAVVVAGDGENRRVIVLIRLIELSRIKIALPVEIDDVSEVVIERRSWAFGGRAGNLTVHRTGDCRLNVVTIYASGVADRVKHQRPCILSGF